ENNGSKAKEKKKNALAFVATGGGRPEGGGAMPDSVPQKTLVVTSRPAATSAIATSPWAPLVAIAGQKQILLYHTDNHQLLGILPFDEGVAQSLRFSRDGSFLIAGGGEHSVNGIVAVYNVKSGERVAVVGDELDTVFDGDANDAMNRIALGGPKKMLRIYDATDGSKLFDLKKHTDWIYAVAYSPDGVLVASGDRSGGLCVWESETGRLYLDLTDHKGAIHGLSWRDDSNVLASCSADGTVKLWEMNQGKAIKSINVNGGAVMDVSFDHQGRLVTGSADNKAKLWNADGGHAKDFQPMAEDVLEVEITHDGKAVVYGDWTGQIFIADTDDPAKRTPLAANPPTTQERLEEVKKVLASVQSELNPLQSAMQAAQAAVEAAKVPIATLEKQIADKNNLAKAASDEVTTATAELQAIDGLLPQLTSQSRDLQDSLIAARVKSKSDVEGQLKPENIEALAVAEQALGDHLLALAAKRRARNATTQKIAAAQARSESLKSEATKLAEGLPPLKQQLDAAIAAAGAAKQAHDQVATRLVSIQKRHDALAAEAH
ncbi:hypothetical protein N9N28_11915, partial [Rubripirellula amarantea]|nr:hypothetical protein [Rubripirellula amarantea]